ncbi:rhodanese-like domain-containing protein [Acidocella sp.]|jgi:rhodanese-related sulfurtransferase|uniref:rhodanese-like domain-containing protein n=1 Tax=Acidocella sp. TaxID=50710 RepID=UPI00262CB51A|nr:rhodanese-like domain-containing protein [Acidocella sp.]
MIEDVPPRQVWEALMSHPDAVLCDVRTQAEWNFVGLPELSEAGKQPLLIQWQLFPGMQPNPKFLEELAAKVKHAAPVYFLCRTGGRSLAAAQAAQAAGYKHVFNVKDGFEGPLDARGHRGAVAGWKADGLPWRQK